MNTTPTHDPRQYGFTLMELTISLVLLGLLSVVSLNMMSGSFFTTRVISDEHLASSTARYAMERMSREIREIRYDATNDVLSISVMTPSQLSFAKSGLGGSTTNMSFNYVGTNLGMTAGTVTATLADNITQFSFTFFDVNNAVTNTPNAVRSVRITLKAAPAQAQPITLVTQIRLRNV